MKLGLIARSDNSGLGMQTWEFYRHMKPLKTMVVDISKFNNNKTYPERYGNECMFVIGFPQHSQIRAFLDGLDVVFIAESAYDPEFYNLAREMGVKTAVQYNYEFMDWLINPEFPKPDMLIAPSKWHYNEVEAWCQANGVQHGYLHCPVDRERLAFRKITKAKTFIHNAGRSAAHDRNGTELVIEAARHIKSDVDIIITFQGEQGLPHQATKTVEQYGNQVLDTGCDKLSLIKGDVGEYWENYEHGDVMLLPRRYGGNCLPLNEALSVGMPVIMLGIDPVNQFLPDNWLIPTTTNREFTPRTTVNVFDTDPIYLARKIDEFASLDENRMRWENLEANQIAQRISWKALEPRYKKALSELCTR